jgi:hypothetical protein
VHAAIYCAVQDSAAANCFVTGASDSIASSAPRTLKFRNSDFLARGTFGSVFVAADILTSERFAIKVSSAESALDLAHEMQLLQGLVHPNILRVFGLCTVDSASGKQGLVMELASSISQARLLTHRCAESAIERADVCKARSAVASFLKQRPQEWVHGDIHNHGDRMQRSTAQHSTVQYSTVQYCTVLTSLWNSTRTAPKSTAVLCARAQDDTAQLDEAQHRQRMLSRRSAAQCCMSHCRGAFRHNIAQ